MQIAPTDFWLVWFQHLDHTQHMCCLLHISSRCTSVLNHYVGTNRKYITGDLQNVSSEVFPIRSFFSSIWMLFCHVLSEYVRVPFFPASICIFLRSSPLICLKSCLSRSLLGAAYQKAWSSRCCFWDSSRCCLWYLKMLMLFYCVSYRLIVLCIVEECILFDFKFFFGKWRWRNLVEHRFAQRDPESTAAATGAIGAKVQDKMDKYKRYRKRMKKVCYCLFMFVAMLKTGINYINYLSRGTQA